jgi:peptide/nickel transport system permease protein
VDTVMMRGTDTILAIPALIRDRDRRGHRRHRARDRGPVHRSLFTWPEAARVVRSVVLSLREQDFVLAARALGATNLRIMNKHLIFHALAPLTVTGTFTVAIALLTEASLSYLGIGVRPPQSSWGNMLYDAQQLFILRDYLWYWLPPGLAIFITVLAINLIGDGLRDALDPNG